jgi:hypothetical protein
MGFIDGGDSARRCFNGVEFHVMDDLRLMRVHVSEAALNEREQSVCRRLDYLSAFARHRLEIVEAARRKRAWQHLEPDGSIFLRRIDFDRYFR